ncbi:MAG: hypothetical protein WC755_00600 [Candidatus Woesearchaeota archaeon]|jgi:hypothetical protein
MNEDKFNMRVNEEIDDEESMEEMRESSFFKEKRKIRVTFYYCPNCFEQRVKGLNEKHITKCCKCNADLIKKELALSIDEEQIKKDSHKDESSKLQG